MTTDPSSVVRRRPGRRHAAPGGRILVGGLSGSAALVLMGAMAQDANPSTDPSTTTTLAGATAPPTVIIVRRAAGADAGTPAAPYVLPTAAAPVTNSHGS